MGKQPFRVALPAARRILGTKKGVIWIFSPQSCWLRQRQQAAHGTAHYTSLVCQPHL